MDMTFPPSGADKWHILCLESMLRLRQLNSEEAAMLVRAASQLPKYRRQPPDKAAADLLCNSVVQPSARDDSDSLAVALPRS
jgi:hypothetical protein